jgi:hypothetical protein
VLPAITLPIGDDSHNDEDDRLVPLSGNLDINNLALGAGGLGVGMRDDAPGVDYRWHAANSGPE